MPLHDCHFYNIVSSAIFAWLHDGLAAKRVGINFASKASVACPRTMLRHFPGAPGTPSWVALLGGACLVTAAALWPLVKKATGSGNRYIASPRSELLETLSDDEIKGLPYPPDVLPGGRDVATPYGSVRVFEWGPEDGEKMLFLHGISTPTISQGDLAHEMAAKGYRVMLFGWCSPVYFTRSRLSLLKVWR